MARFRSYRRRNQPWLAQSEALRFRFPIRYAMLVMSVSRRYFAPGQLQFVTSSVYRRLKLFESQRFRSVFLETLRELRREKGFLLLGWVLMPEHFHLLIKPEPAEATSGIMRELKKRTAQAIVSILGENQTYPGAAKCWPVCACHPPFTPTPISVSGNAVSTLRRL